MEVTLIKITYFIVMQLAYENKMTLFDNLCYITCKKSGGLHLVEPGLMAGRLVVWQTKFK